MALTEYSSLRRNSERSYNIDLDQLERRNLNVYIQNELNYYNSLINGLNSKVRVFQNEILSIKDRYERLWLTIAQTGVDVRSFVKKDTSEWPQEFVEFRSIIGENKKLLLSEKMMILYDIAKTPADIHPVVRRSIANEVLKTIQPQVKIMVDSAKNINGNFNTAIQLLQPADIQTKRHVQLFKNNLTIRYNSESNTSSVSIPYLEKEIEIKYNLQKMDYDNVIIRQIPVRDVNANTQWQIIFKEGTGRYLLDFMDSTRRTRR